MNLLYLCQRIPYPPDRGDRIPVFHQLKSLSRSHRVVLGTLAHHGTEWNARELQKQLGIKVWAPHHSLFYRMGEILTAFLQGKPLTLGYFKNRRLQALIDSEITNTRFDAVIVFSSSMAQYVRQYAQIPRIMDFCDVDSQKWESMAQHSHGLMRWIYRRESRILLEFEREIAAEFDFSCVVAETEADLFRKKIPGIPVHVIENGVDAEFFSAVPRQPEGLRIVFVGVMDYPPNVEAALFFAKHVWSRVVAVSPGAQFFIVGSRPNRKILNLAHTPGIKVTGYVPDIRPYLASATLSIAPLAIARGVQNKILEAMAAGTPVLTTPDVGKGLPSGAQQFVFTATRDPESFGSALLRLIENRANLEEKAAKGRDFIRQNHTWKAKIRALDELLEKVTTQKKWPHILEKQRHDSVD